MAKLSAHGKEIGRIEYLTKTLAFFEGDRTILVNYGYGWKKYNRVINEGVNPRDAYSRRKQKNEKFLAEHPAFAAYKKALFSICGLSKRGRLHIAVQLSWQDPDGVWSDVCDGYGDNVSASIEEVVELCNLYQAAQKECDEINQKESE
jgi:hypothetical protein